MTAGRPVLLYIALGLSALALASTLPFDPLDIDSSSYALIAREMIEESRTDDDEGCVIDSAVSASGECAWWESYVFLRQGGRRYFDKPILTFWTVAASFSVFGFSNWAYRLPALLITLISVYSIFRITVLISGDRRRGLIAALLYATAPGVFAMLLDTKIDVYLNAYLIFLHHAYYLGVKENRRWYLLMYLFAGLGFITKGPIAVAIPCISIGLDILVRRDWQRLGSMYLVPGILIALIPPAVWTFFLYLEYESYGPYYFLWLQSFGRFISKANYSWSKKYDPLFFLSNFAWAFAPFLLALFYHVIREIAAFFRRGEYRTLLSDLRGNRYKDRDFTLPFWLFVFMAGISFSRFQLPQYVYWVLPAAAILTSGVLARYLYGAYARAPEAPAASMVAAVTGTGRAEERQAPKLFRYLLYVVPVLIAIVLIAAAFVTFTPGVLYFVILVGGAVFAWNLRREPGTGVAVTIAAILAAYFVATAYIYPDMIRYQPGSRMGPILQKLEPEEDNIYTYRLSFSYKSIPLYSYKRYRVLYDKDKLRQELREKGSRLVATHERFYPELQLFLSDCCEVELVENFEWYKVSMPKPRFFIRSERPELTQGQGIIVAKMTLKDSE